MPAYAAPSPLSSRRNAPQNWQKWITWPSSRRFEPPPTPKRLDQAAPISRSAAPISLSAAPRGRRRGSFSDGRVELAVISVVGVAHNLAWQSSAGGACQVFFFGHPALVGLAIATAVLLIAALFTRGNLSPGEREDRSNRWVFGAFGVLMLLLAYLPAYTDRRDIWTLGGDTMRWVGVGLVVVGGVLRLWPVFVLGHRFSGLVRFSPDTRCADGSASTPSFVTRAISACWSARWDGRSRSAPRSACC